jgi:hypothetical protein
MWAISAVGAPVVKCVNQEKRTCSVRPRCSEPFSLSTFPLWPACLGFLFVNDSCVGEEGKRLHLTYLVRQRAGGAVESECKCCN